MASEHIYALPKGYRLTLGERNYELQELLGHGNFGLTYLAYDHQLERHVAIKEMLPFDFAARARDGVRIVARGGPKNEESLEWARRSFLNEAKTLASLQHPSIVPVYDFFEDNGTAYLVMAYIDGDNLEAWLNKHARPSEDFLRTFTLTLLSALALVHEGGVMHRDLKPENIRMDRKSKLPVLIDFGNARMMTGLKTSNISAIVTAGYGPIEQYQTNGRQGPWTDLYALGAVLYRIFMRTDPPWATDRHENDPLVKLAHHPDLREYSTVFLAAIDKALQRRAQDRWQTCAAWEKALYVRPPLPPTPSTTPWGKIGAAFASCAVLGGSSLLWFTQTPQSSEQASRGPVMAVEYPLGRTLKHGKGAVDFGESAIGMTSTRTVVVKNVGQAELEGLALAHDGADEFSVSRLSSAPLPPQEDTNFIVSFTPREAGIRTATLHLASNSSDRDRPFDIIVSGIGAPPRAVPEPPIKTPDISLEQPVGTMLADGGSILKFGNITVGTESILDLTIRNTGQAELQVLSYTDLDGPAAKEYFVRSNGTSRSIAPGSTGTLSIRFMPAEAGPREASLHISSNAPGDRKIFDLGLMGVGQDVPKPKPRDSSGPWSFENPFINSLGMKFVPFTVVDLAPDGSVVTVRTMLGCIYETRKSDYGQIIPDYKISGSPEEPVTVAEPRLAKNFCLKLSALEGRNYHLPTDQEWSSMADLKEPAAMPWKDKKDNERYRKVFPWGETTGEALESLGNYASHKVCDVGKYRANPFGFYDLGGNVLEMCTDQNSGADSILMRGGSFMTRPWDSSQATTPEAKADIERNKLMYFTSAWRQTFAASEAAETGFRIVLEP
ncbi:serine/threonine protein kinase [Roseimicrobium gellanilyticum]|uniref:Serine/threonine protein kinase n=1 Tax=Roseimicrobium gellanilyticum TaxID=748857 RepID=A0A366HF75_9BACT|nr:choice-of-anchor D domain-containing protein [Roseimicrobium gellanilyticum]RBP41232.1 serine/threonine protein kinase [Roseimicrobium gellanilyticum]